jgi:hypothetical protein
MFMWRSRTGEIWLIFLFKASMMVAKRRREGWFCV